MKGAREGKEAGWAGHHPVWLRLAKSNWILYAGPGLARNTKRISKIKDHHITSLIDTILVKMNLAHI